MRNVIYVAIILAFLTGKSVAQIDDYHPEFQWYTIKGEYCDVHFHEGAERTARTVARIADDVYEPITSLYEYRPGKTHYVIKDIDDYANGATYFFDNKIEIWTSALDMDLRGNHNWLRNVITHEFTHLVQLQAAMKGSRRVPAVYLQWLNYEEKRRPDILYGFPNVIASYPLPTVNVPAWFAEGTAQYQRVEFRYDDWDSHRDMILRCYALDDNMLTWGEMGVFGKSSLGNESVYNAGYAFTRYLSQKYGEESLKDLTDRLGDFTTVTMDGAFEGALGVTGEEAYEEWRSFLRNDYEKRTAKIRENPVVGDTIADVGFGNFYPKRGEDGALYYLSNKTADYFLLTGLYRRDTATEEDELLVPGVHSAYDFLPGKDKIVFAKLSDDNPNGYNVHDLYVYDIAEDDVERLTEGLRANQPDVSPDGEKIVFLFQKDGTSNLGVVNADGKNFRQITFFGNGEQVYAPKFNPSGDSVYFGTSYHVGRDLARVSVEGGPHEIVVKGAPDARNAAFDDEGRLVYVADETGVFNVYRLDLQTGERQRLTNVIGGAFQPSIGDDGELLYSGYTSRGFKIFRLENPAPARVKDDLAYDKRENPPLDDHKAKGDVETILLDTLAAFDDRDMPPAEKERYSGEFTSLSFFPFLRFDNYNQDASPIERIKPGVYVASSDMLNRYAVFGGASINANLERDLFLIFDYRDKLPLLFDLGLNPTISLEAYNISRKANVELNFEEDENLPDALPTVWTDVAYNLMEFDLVARDKVFGKFDELELRYIYSRYTATLESFTLPIPDNPQLYPTTHDTYLSAGNLQAKYRVERYLPYRDRDINPIGWEAEFQYNYEMNEFNDEGEYEIVDGMLKPVYNTYDFHRIETNLRFAAPFWGLHTLGASVRYGSIIGETVPDFFDFYLGGLIGMKAYPFYALSGNELIHGNLTYRFPLWRGIDARLGPLYFDKMFFSLYADAGNAWTGEMDWENDWKRGVGAELRVKLFSFYLFPTSVFFNGAYALDKITREIDDEIVTYGEEWRFYGGVLFGFDI